MKPGPNYRMSKPLKTSLALARFQDPHLKGAWKRAMIDAELCAAVQPKRETRKSNNGDLNTHSSGTVSSGSQTDRRSL